MRYAVIITAWEPNSVEMLMEMSLASCWMFRWWRELFYIDAYLYLPFATLRDEPPSYDDHAETVESVKYNHCRR